MRIPFEFEASEYTWPLVALSQRGARSQIFGFPALNPNNRNSKRLIGTASVKMESTLLGSTPRDLDDAEPMSRVVGM
jgi:hypothetical protein